MVFARKNFTFKFICWSWIGKWSNNSHWDCRKYQCKAKGCKRYHQMTKYTFGWRMQRQPWLTSASSPLNGNSLKRNFLTPSLFFCCKGNHRTFVQGRFVPTFLWWIIALFICQPPIKILLQRAILIYVIVFVVNGRH